MPAPALAPQGSCVFVLWPYGLFIMFRVSNRYSASADCANLSSAVGYTSICNFIKAYNII